MIKTISENPLTVTVDGVVTEILTFTYTDSSGTPRTCKYIVANGKSYPIVFRADFDVTLLPKP